MKKVLMTVFAASTMLFAVSCNDDDSDTTITANDLPQAAQDFISLNFPDRTIVHVKRDNDRTVDYDVVLDNNFDLEFTETGEWKEVDCKGVEIPETFKASLPSGISTYVETNHGTYVITKVERNGTQYEIDLNNGLEIVFSATGEFVRYDD